MTKYITSKNKSAKTELNFFTLFWLFLIGSVIGFVVEGIWAVIKTGHWEHHAATLWGPFCIIYGVGAVVVYVTSYFLRNKNIVIKFVVYVFSGALVEYFGSLFQEICFGSVSWDYSSHSLDIGGRVSLRMALIWGVLGIVFMYFLYPAIKRLLSNCHKKPLKIAACALAGFMAINLSLTALAVLRWNDRLNDVPPANKIETLIDATYGNEKMEQLFSNMRFTAEND